MDKIIIQNTINNRNNSLDVLRILSMILIISLHFLSYSGIKNAISELSPTFIVYNIIQSISLVAVNCYILISGYFFLTSKFTLKKIFFLLLEVWFYSVIIYLLLWKFDYIEFGMIDFLEAFFPTLTREYWYVTSYVGCYVCTPILRAIINKMTQKEHLVTVLGGFILFVLYYNLFFFTDNLNFGGATGIVWFGYLYFVASYIFLYYEASHKRVKNSLMMYLLSFGLIIVSRGMFWIVYAETQKEIFMQGANIFSSVYNSILVFFSSIAFFILFLNLRIRIENTRLLNLINILSSSTFAVYLIHDNKYIRELIWNLIDYQIYNQLWSFIICWLITILLIFFGGILIDLVRRKAFIFLIKSQRVDRGLISIQRQLMNTGDTFINIMLRRYMDED